MNTKEVALQTDIANEIQFVDIFVLEDIQRLQDLFSDANGVASIITQPDGTPITKPSNFCRLCSQIIRKTDKGLKNCFKSDALLGQHNPSGPIVQPCLSGGLWDAGAIITIGGQHIANWLIGQVRNEDLDEKRMLKYADEIGANQKDFMDALAEVPVMSKEQFNKVSNMLFAFANELSERAYKNLLLKTEIAEREKATEQLKVSEEKYRSLVQYSSDPIFSFNPDETYRFVNEAFATPFGKTPEDIIGKKPHSIFSHDEAEKRLTLVRHVFKTEQKGEIDVKVTTPTGEVRYYLTIADPIKNDQGQIIFVSCVSKNITERKLVELALRESEEKYRQIAENISDVVWTSDLNLNVTYISPSVEKLLGIPANKQMNTPVEERITPDSLKRIKAIQLEEFEKEKDPNCDKNRTRIIEAEHYRADGSTIWVAMNISSVRDRSGSIIGFQGVNRDISERKKIEEKVQKIGSHYKALIEKAPDGVVLINAEGHFTFVSPAARKIFGYTLTEEILVHPDTITHPDDLNMVLSHLARLFEDPEYVPMLQYRIADKNGNLIWVESIFSNLLADPSVESIVINFRNITERKLAEEALKKKTNHLEILNGHFIDRELKMISLKKEINDLLNQAGKEDEYVIHGKTEKFDNEIFRQF